MGLKWVKQFGTSKLWGGSLVIETNIVLMMNCFCGMLDWWKTFSLISSRDHCQRSLPSQISDMPQAGFEPAKNLWSGLVDWSYAVVITTTPQCHNSIQLGSSITIPAFYNTKVIKLGSTRNFLEISR